MRLRLSLACVVVSVAVTSCGQQVTRTDPVPPGAAPSSSAAATTTGLQNPADLVGLWRVAEAGEEPGTEVRFGIGGSAGLELFQPCGRAFGSWRADATGLLLAGLNGKEGAYPGSGRTTECPASVTDTPWIQRAVAYRSDGTDRLLLDSGGKVLARLVPRTKDDQVDGTPEEPTVLSEEQRQEMRRMPAPLPSQYRPATRSEMVGRWEPVRAAADFDTDPYAQLRADGTWGGHDGCNGEGGRWNAGQQGNLLVDTGISAGVGCNLEDKVVSIFPSDARRAGFDGATLVLFDFEGKQVARLRRG